jgi:hypothetical protein
VPPRTQPPSSLHPSLGLCSSDSEEKEVFFSTSYGYFHKMQTHTLDVMTFKCLNTSSNLYPLVPGQQPVVCGVAPPLRPQCRVGLSGPSPPFLQALHTLCRHCTSFLTAFSANHCWLNHLIRSSTSSSEDLEFSSVLTR